LARLRMFGVVYPYICRLIYGHADKGKSYRVASVLGYLLVFLHCADANFCAEGISKMAGRLTTLFTQDLLSI